MHSPNLTDENIARIRELFPGCVTEARDESGALKLAVDFDQLKQELSDSIVEGPQERYNLNWPGKREALLTANAPIAKTLRPCREESVDFDTTKNLFIDGDNLDALKLLQETYLGKVKMIYIDPPYNTGNDFIYEDDFAENANEFLLRSNQKDEEGKRLLANTESNGRFHSDWLSMIYPRLKLARNLLKNNGVIFISIDDNEVHNLRKLCDEIFGEENFVANIMWQKKTSPDARMNISAAHDHIICYSKSIFDFSLNSLPFDEERKKSFTNPDNDPRGPWASVDLTGQTGRAPKSQFYTITTPTGVKMPPPDGRCWALAESTFQTLQKDNRIWFGINKSNRPRLKKFLSESEGVRPWTWWDNKSVGHNQEASQEVKALFDGQTIFDNPKPVRLLQRIIQLSTQTGEHDIVLDFFSGSATTANSLFIQNIEDNGNRKFILVQLPESVSAGSNDYKSGSTAFKLGYKTIAEISKERIRRAGKKIKDDCGRRKDENNSLFSDSENSSVIPHPSSLDIGFRVLKIDSSNMAEVYYTPDAVNQGDLFNTVDNIKPDRTPEDLLFQVLLDAGVDLSLPIRKENIQIKDEGGRIKAEKNVGESSSVIPHPSSFSSFEVFFVDENALVACFDTDVNEELVRELAQFRSYDMPIRKMVFRDNGFASDAVKINVEQIFRQLSPGTEVKSI